MVTTVWLTRPTVLSILSLSKQTSQQSFATVRYRTDEQALRPEVRLAFLLAVAMLGLLAVRPVVPEPVDLFLLERAGHPSDL